ncbi:MAG: c-type cytochrome [Anaerolineaceae bacterium]|nr:c-type cytochrome [Anaerolineaceae bacterium]
MSTRSWIILLVTFLFIVILAACYPNPQPPGLTPVPSLAPAATLTLLPAIQGGVSSSGPQAVGSPDPAEGVAIYMLHCSQCHGVNGEGGVGLPLRNSAFVKAGGQSIIDTISNGRPGSVMPGWALASGGPLTPVEISDVIAFINTLQNVSPLPSATPQPVPPTDTPEPANAPTAEPAEPSNSGGPGAAASLVGDPDRGKPLFGQYCAACHGAQGALGIPNPGSDDGTIPDINPIDPTILDSNYKTFATHVDLFVEHGSVPSGPSPLFMMPPFGDNKLLTVQQISDIISYVIQLNGVSAPK